MQKTSVLTITPCPFLANSLRDSLRDWGYKFLGNLEKLEDYIPHSTTNDRPMIALLDEVLLCEQVCSSSVLNTALQRDVRFLILAKTLTYHMKIEILRCGAYGYVMVSHDTKFLKKAIDELSLGGVWAERHVLHAVFLEHCTQAYRARDTGSITNYIAGLNPIDGLTDRERTVVKYVGFGLRNKEIARKLDISETTVRLHLNRIYRKLGVSSRLQLGLLLVDKTSNQAISS